MPLVLNACGGAGAGAPGNPGKPQKRGIPDDFAERECAIYASLGPRVRVCTLQHNGRAGLRWLEVMAGTSARSASPVKRLELLQQAVAGARELTEGELADAGGSAGRDPAPARRRAVRMGCRKAAGGAAPGPATAATAADAGDPPGVPWPTRPGMHRGPASRGAGWTALLSSFQMCCAPASHANSDRASCCHRGFFLHSKQPEGSDEF